MLSISLNYTSGVPIYVQLKDAIKLAVKAGVYSQGAQLPTVRQLAVQLKINANTVSRAYAELEREGVLSTQQGRGTFITLPNEIDYEKLTRMEQLAEQLLADSAGMGFTIDDVLAVIENIRRTKMADHE
ncbi:MAG: putative transcriptional regulator [Firmicutes bacterium]|nr:putative transcriptional regulator [Bacillota bacterium]